MYDARIMLLRFLTAAAAASFVLIAPLVASAQDAPSYAHPAVPSYGTQDQEIHGRIIGFDGAYVVELRDDRGYVDTVRLHQGTVINPIGLTLGQGMVVSIDGYNAGSYFSANEIDTPYTMYGYVPYYGGRPWYAYGPDVSFGFFFGDGEFRHGREGYFRHDERHFGGDRHGRFEGRHR
jgi:hypothetical protein